MSQTDIDSIIINTEMTIKEKVKVLCPLIMLIHNLKYPNAYQRAKGYVDVEWRLKLNKRRNDARNLKSKTDPIYRALETARKNAIIKNKYNTDPEYKAKKNEATRGNNYLNKLRRELF
jgi:hypothetical protein